MNDYNITAAMEADYAVEMASNPALRALTHVVPAEHIKQVWCLGYLTGGNGAFQRVKELFAENNHA